MNKSKLKVAINDSLFLSALCLWILQQLLYTTSAFNNFMDSYKTANITMIVVVSLLSLKFLSNGISIKTIFFTMLSLALIIIICFNAEEFSALIMLFFFIYSSRDVHFKKIIKITFFTHVIVMTITILGCNLGLIENAYNFKEDGVLRYYLGYINLNAPIYFSYITLMFIYLRKEKINIYDFLVIAVINYYLYISCNVRAQFYITIVTIIGAYLLKFFKIDLNTKPIKNLFIYSIPTCAIVSIGSQVFYDSSNNVMSLLNEFLTGRLKLGFNAYKEYGIKLFGQPIKWVLDSDIDNGIWYSYVDSSFLKYTLMYGSVFMMIIIIGFVIISKEAVKANDRYLCFVILIIALNNMFNPHLLYIHFNVFILLFGYFFNNSNKKIKDFYSKIDTFK